MHLKTLDVQSDEQLMSLLSEGEEQALGTLIERYQNDVFRFCLHYLKEVESSREMTQETFLRVFSARDRFDTERKFKPWMLCIARNLCFNEIKRKKTVWMESLEEYASSAREQGGELSQSAAENPDELAMEEERRQGLLEVLKTLPDDAREMVKLRYFEKLSAREIAEIMESTEGAVRTRLHRIIKQMRGQCEHLFADM
jgi:RNA polymerase sigma-70 factor (ECF subfamily)